MRASVIMFPLKSNLKIAVNKIQLSHTMEFSVKMWMGVIMLCVTTMMSIIGLATPSWLVGNDGTTDMSIGLWKACLDLTCVSVFDDKYSVIHTMGTWLYFTQAGICLGFSINILCVFGTFVAYLHPAYRGKYQVLQFIAICIFLAAIAYGYGTFLYAYEAESMIITDHSYLKFGLAFYISVTEVTLALASGLIYYLEYKDQSSIRRAYLILN